MGLTAETGPLVTFGQAQNLDNNPNAGPSAWFQGDMLLDPRAQWTYQPGNPFNPASIRGWLSTTAIPVIDQVPSTASATNIASATPATGVPLALVSSSGAGITVGCSIINAATGQLVTGLLGIDVNAVRTATATFTNGSPKITLPANTMSGIQVGDALTFTSSGTLPTGFSLLTTYYIVAIGQGSSTTLALMVSATPGGAPISAGSAGSGTQTYNVVAGATLTAPPVSFGSPTGQIAGAGPMAAWNPAWAISRAIVVTSNGADTSGFYTVNGYDIYGFPMSQKLTGVSSTTATTTKTFKYIASVVPSGTIASTTLTVGTADVFGLPLRADAAQYVLVSIGGPPPVLVAIGSIGFVAADITTPSQTTGDVRGTVTGGTASDGTRRLYVVWTSQAANMNSTVGLLGQTQV